MNAGELARALPGWSLRYYRSVDSTNAVARAWLADDVGPGEPALVVADEQTAGRGRFDRRWETPAGAAVAMSILLRAPGPSGFPQAAGVAVAEAVGSLVDAPVGLKWPNDVEIAGRKVAGILIEHERRAGEDWYITGIGVNVEIDFDTLGAPARELSQSATSIASHLSREVDIDRTALVADIAGRFLVLRSDPELQARWKGLLTTLGRVISVRGAGGTISGRAIDVDSNGSLLLEDESGRRHAVAAGDVTVVSGGFPKSG